jgi:cytochrome c biogenesis protein CcmG/thiol:disulfide interchange protein DsbE
MPANNPGSNEMETPETSETETPRQSVSPAWIAAGAIALLVLGLLIYSVMDQPSAPPQIGGPAPAFQITALDGGSMELGSQPGKVTVVNFFASWCVPCRQEATDLEETWREYQDRDVQFFGIAYKDAHSKAQSFLDEFGVSYPSAVDPGNSTARAYGVTGVPETFVVDRDGVLIRHFLGPITQSQLSIEIDKALVR